MDLAFSRVRQYQRVLGDWEGSQELGEGEGEQTVPESAELQSPPMVLNWRRSVQDGGPKVCLWLDLYSAHVEESYIVIYE